MYNSAINLTVNNILSSNESVETSLDKTNKYENIVTSRALYIGFS
jgi:hypothetical protein